MSELTSRREARLAAEQRDATQSAAMPRRDRADRIATILLVAAAVSVTLGGVALALGFPRPHTLLVYAAVALGALGVLLALPRVLSSIPFDPTTPMPRRRSDD
jgi:heme A synthase